MRPIVAALAFALLFLNGVAQATERATLKDVSVMNFSIAHFEASNKVEDKNPFTGEVRSVDAPAGKQFVIVTLTGQLAGLRDNYSLVAKIHNQFVVSQKGLKQYSEAVMIKGVFGWDPGGSDGMQVTAYGLGSKVDQANWEKEDFTVAFALPLDWTKLEIAVRKLDAASEGYKLSSDVVEVGEIDLKKTVKAATSSKRSAKPPKHRKPAK